MVHSTDHGWKVKSTNLFQVAKPKTTLEETTGTHYSREKPVALYSDLIKLFAKPKTWVMDVFSGCGKREQRHVFKNKSAHLKSKIVHALNTILAQFMLFNAVAQGWY